MSDQPAPATGQRADRPGPPAAPPPGLFRLSDTSRATKIASISAVLATVALAIVSVTGGLSGNRTAPRTPPAARNFSLPALGHPGQRVTLAAFAGRPVIINFFASWCTPCKHETPALARFYRQSKGQVTIIGVDSNDQNGPAIRFVRSAGVRYLVAADPFPASTTTHYGVFGLPQTFFLNAGHRIVKRVFGAVTAKQLSEGVALMDNHPGQPSPGPSGG